MESITGKPELMKQMNRTLLYRTLLEAGSATRAEIAGGTQISTTTVRTLLEELIAAGEVTEERLDVSSGGRRAQRYQLNPQRNLVLSFYIEASTLFYQVAELTGGVICTKTAEVNPRHLLQTVTAFVEHCREQWAICAIGLGVAGILGVSHTDSAEMETLGNHLARVCDLPVLLENDLNAIAMGFAIGYAADHPGYDLNRLHMVYIHFNQSCTGAGILADGKIIRGAKQFAGELGYLPMGAGQSLDQVLQSPDKAVCADAIARVIAMVNCVTNPSLAVVGGDRFVRGTLDPGQVQAAAGAYANGISQPVLLFRTDSNTDYLKGLHYLAAQMVIPRLPLGNQSGNCEGLSC